MLIEDYEVDLLGKLPRYHRKILEFQQIAKALNPEFVFTVEAINRVLANMFIATMDETAVSRMEGIVGIVPEDTDTLDVRKVKLQAKFSECLPYTDETLDERLTTLCGEDGYRIIRDYANYALDIITMLDNGNIFDTVIDTLDVIMPCNLNVTYKNQIDTVSPLNLYVGGVSKLSENVTVGSEFTNSQDSSFSVSGGAVGSVTECISVGCDFTFTQVSTMPLTSGGASRVIEIIN